MHALKVFQTTDQKLTYLCDIGMKLVIRTEWQHRAWYWSYQWRKRQPHTTFVTFTDFEIVLKNWVQNATDAKRWFNDRWSDISNWWEENSKAHRSVFMVKVDYAVWMQLKHCAVVLQCIHCTFSSSSAMTYPHKHWTVLNTLRHLLTYHVQSSGIASQTTSREWGRMSGPLHSNQIYCEVRPSLL